MNSLKMKVSGKVTERSETTDETERQVKLETKTVHFTKEFTDPIEFHHIAVKPNQSKAEALLPDNMRPVNKGYAEFDVSLSGNAVNIEKFAQSVAQEHSDINVIDILTLWLQSFHSMRVRRALHTKLRKEGVEVSHVD